MSSSEDIHRFNTGKILELLHRVLPSAIGKRFIKTPKEYLR